MSKTRKTSNEKLYNISRRSDNAVAAAGLERVNGDWIEDRKEQRIYHRK